MSILDDMGYTPGTHEVPPAVAPLKGSPRTDEVARAAVDVKVAWSLLEEYLFDDDIQEGDGHPGEASGHRIADLALIGLLYERGILPVPEPTGTGPEEKKES